MEPHKLDIVSLITGLAFLVIGLGHLLGFNVANLWPGTSRLVSLLVIIAGAVLLLRVVRRTSDP